MKQSNFLSLGWRDFLRGLLIAILTPVIAIISDSAERGELFFNWRLIALSAIGGGCAYLLKNFFTQKDANKTQAFGDPIPKTGPKG